MKLSMPFSAAAVLFAFAIAPAHAGGFDDVKQRGTLVCGTQNASVPYAYQDPNTRAYVGYDVAICQAVAAKLGVSLDHRPLSTEARIAEVKLGRVDAVAGAVAYLPERATQVDFTDMYLQGDIKVLVMGDAKIVSTNDLSDKRICASSGSSSAAVATRTFPNAEVTTLQDVASCFLALQDGKVDAFIAGELLLKRFQNDSAKKNIAVRLLPEALYHERIGMIVQKGNEQLRQAINTALAEIDKSGELDAIFDKWLGKSSDYKLVRNFKVEPVAQ
jgi:polar amino acid transport system substrate-binding protein